MRIANGCIAIGSADLSPYLLDEHHPYLPASIGLAIDNFLWVIRIDWNVIVEDNLPQLSFPIHYKFVNAELTQF